MRMTRHGWHGGIDGFHVRGEKIDAVLILASRAHSAAFHGLLGLGLADGRGLAVCHDIEAVRRAVAQGAALAQQGKDGLGLGAHGWHSITHSMKIWAALALIALP